MDDYLTRFRNKVDVEQTVRSSIGDIIAESLSKCEVYVNESQTAIPVIFINTDKESGDESIIYSYSTDSVVVGDYVNFLGTDHLVYKEIKNLKREGYIDSFKTILCNISFALGAATIKGYFRGPLRTANSDEGDLAESFGVDSKGESLLVIPSTVALGYNDNIIIGDQGWRVVKIDKLTNTGISYLTVEEFMQVNTTKVSDNEPETPVVPPIVPVLPQLSAGITYTFNTEEGFIKSSSEINILERKSAFIKFIIPFGVSNITITTKEEGIEVPVAYKVV